MEDYAALIDAAWGDPVRLGQIADELQAFRGGDAFRLRCRAISRRRELRATVVQPLAVSPRSSGGWLEELGVERRPGLPLHRYNLSEDAFLRLQADLRSRRLRMIDTPGAAVAGRFVLWAAEWFRRCYDGTGQRWDALARVLGKQCGWSDWRHLTDAGMRFWGLQPLVLGGVHHRLAAIARQGGFPVAALERQSGGWAPRFLEALVAAVSASALRSFESASEAAANLLGMVPETWRSLEMRVVSAELALEVVNLRELAEADGVPPGSLVVPWLDQKHPGWRERLPLSIGSESARTLVDGLMKVAPLQGGSGAVSCTRLLWIGGGSRRELVDLSLAGAIHDATGRSITRTLSAEWSRLRLFASGELAQHVAGELAIVDPDGDAWLARPSVQRTRFDVPFEVPIIGELRGGGQRVTLPFVLAGGERVGANLRVLAEHGAEDPAGLLLRHLGTGSGGYREEVLYLDIPSDWIVSRSGDDAEFDGVAVGDDDKSGRSIWRVKGSVVANSPRGDSYLVRTGQRAGQRDTLILLAEDARGFRSSDAGLQAATGRPGFLLRENARERAPRDGELWWRPAGGSGWRNDLRRAGPGPCEFAWRDERTGHLRDRKDLLILPEEFSVEVSRTCDWNSVGVEGWPGSVTPAACAGIVEAEPGRWRVPARGSSSSLLELRLSGAQGGEFGIVVALDHQAWIEGWQDGPLPRNGRIWLSNLHRYVARAPGRCELLADLVDRNGRGVPGIMASWIVEDELPLASVRDDIAALLRPCGDIRASVRLNFNDGREDYWFVGEFGHELEDVPGGLIARPAVSEEVALVCGRALGDPARERADLGTHGLLDALNHRPICLPRLEGPWLVYLRSGDRVLSCPRVVPGEPERPPHGVLGAAMLVPEFHGRQRSLLEAFDLALADPEGSKVRELARELVDLALSLDGLPPATFDALRLVGERPRLACAMVFGARRTELEPLLRLAEGLPFAWWLFPVECWRDAARAQVDYLFSKVPDEPALIAAAMREACSAICELEPALRPVLEYPGTDSRPLQQAANDFLVRSVDRIESGRWSPFRPGLASDLPAWTFSNRYWRALDAPVAAALAASGRGSLDEAQVACAKDIARRHPNWFREAYAAALRES